MSLKKYILHLFCLLLSSIILTSLSLLLSAQNNATIAYGFTYQNATGNRYVEGTGTFPNVENFIIENIQTAGMWLTPLRIGEEQLVRGSQEEWSILYSLDLMMPSDMALPQTLTGLSALWQADFSADDVSRLSHPVPVGDDIVYIANNGDLVLWRDNNPIHRLPLDAMLDARPMVSDNGLIALYTQPTDRYPHGVFGDLIEAGALDILQVDGDILRRVGFVQLDDVVFEGLYPFWADIDQDGQQDIVTTISGSGLGAGLQVYRADGTLLTESRRIELSNRWRHQLAFAPFGPDGEYELVEIQTPHIGGIVQFLRYMPDTNSLEIVARFGGYTSHLYGSINLDMAVAGDFDGDGQPELVVTTQDGRRLVGLHHGADDSIEEVWSIDLPAVPVTNFSAITTADGRLGLAIGLIDNTLHISLSTE